jgi:hypothetical protein
MSVVVPKWRFTEAMVQDAPDFRGVYVLWANGVPLAVGHARGAADTIRSRLLAHLAHGEAAGLGPVTHYSWEICADPLKREAEVAAALKLRARSREHTQADPLSQRVDRRADDEREWSARGSS